jgi:hypothetical protein
MRLNDVRQLREIRDHLKDIPDNVITDFYYHIEDFLRASISVDELSEHIRLVYDSISRFLGSRGAPEIPASLDVMDGNRKVATLICMVSESDTVGFQHLLEAVKEYKVNVSVIEWSGVSAILFRIQKDGKGLPEDDLTEVVEKLSASSKERF